ncbi:glycosyltransferase [bacterium]|nr:MAG: glycosyltransferase [bacterium]
MTADTVGGVWTYALDLAREIPNVEVSLATMGRPMSPDQRAEANSIPNLEVFESSYKLEWMEEPWHDVRAAGRWLMSLESAIRPDVVHLNGLCHGMLPFEAPKLVVMHSCVLSWWEAVKGEAAPSEWARYAEEVRRGILGADMVVAPTHAMMDATERLYGAPKATRVIPNGRWGVEPQAKEPYVFAAGRMWDEAKNLRTLEAVRERLSWPLFVAGDGSSLGHLDTTNMCDWLGRASIYAFPAKYEPFGLSVLEAALAGCALVLGDIPSLRENWEGRAIFVHPDDEDGLTEAVERLIANPRMRERMGRCAREHALTLSTKRFARGYMSLYKDLVSGVQAEPTSAELLAVSGGLA